MAHAVLGLTFFAGPLSGHETLLAAVLAISTKCRHTFGNTSANSEGSLSALTLTAEKRHFAFWSLKRPRDQRKKEIQKFAKSLTEKTVAIPQKEWEFGCTPEKGLRTAERRQYRSLPKVAQKKHGNNKHDHYRLFSSREKTNLGCQSPFCVCQRLPLQKREAPQTKKCRRGRNRTEGGAKPEGKKPRQHTTRSQNPNKQLDKATPC